MNNMFTNKYRKLKILILGILVTGSSATTTWALLPGAPSVVFDPKLAALIKTLHTIDTQQKRLMHLDTIRKYTEQIIQAKKMYDEQMAYQRQIDGQWQKAIDGIRAEWVDRAMAFRDISQLGWGQDGINADKAFAAIAKFHSELTKIQNGSIATGNVNVKDVLEGIYGDIPTSRDSANAVSNTYKVMAEAASFMGDYNTALKKLEEENQRDSALLAKGGLSPGDIDRVGAQVTARSNDINILNGKMMAVQARLDSDRLGNDARRTVKEYQANVAEKDERLKYLKAARFTPGIGRQRESTN